MAIRIFSKVPGDTAIPTVNLGAGSAIAIRALESFLNEQVPKFFIFFQFIEPARNSRRSLPEKRFRGLNALSWLVSSQSFMYFVIVDGAVSGCSRCSMRLSLRSRFLTAMREIMMAIPMMPPTTVSETPVEICTHGSASIFPPMNTRTMARPLSRYRKYGRMPASRK